MENIIRVTIEKCPLCGNTTCENIYNEDLQQWEQYCTDIECQAEWK